MASGNPENPGFRQVTDHPSRLGSGRMIRQSLPLGETRRLVPVSVPANQRIRRYGFRKSGKSRISPGHRSPVAPRIWAYDTSIASSRRDKTIGTGLSTGKSADPEIWLPEILDFRISPSGPRMHANRGKKYKRTRRFEASYGYGGGQQSYASSYAQPVAQSSYAQPQQSYAQPQQSYAQPQQSYAQPQAAPVSNYVSAPARPVAVPQQTSYASGPVAAPAPAGPSYAQPSVQVPPSYATGQAAAGQTLQEVVDDGEDQQSASNTPNDVNANAQLSSNSTSSELAATGNETSSAEVQTKEPVAISQLKLTNDTECNSEELRAIIIEHMDDDLNSSKRVIQLAAEAKFGGRFDVICSSNDFSYVTNTELFCQETKQTVSCYAYRQLT
ncbi:ground-like domain-containing protein [Ditylenchus destructor]|uniref:Ground-like domain-containing protein n=1 Tax=Ditylenchus destructor TaxID=166010 RepID=A0AAD4NAA7_9BILA|nr:ground-like domain-containing protein [Ditylenchus destructor]